MRIRGQFGASLNVFGSEFPSSPLAAFPLELDLIARYRAGILLLNRVAAVFHLHGERDSVPADFAVRDCNVVLTAGNSPRQLVAIYFEIERLLTCSTLAAGHLSGPLTRDVRGQRPERKQQKERNRRQRNSHGRQYIASILHDWE